MKTDRIISPALRGFVLLEVILALALFATVTTAMTVALKQLAESTTAARRESLLLRRLQSEVVETAHAPRLQPGASEEPADAWGISIYSLVEPLSVKTEAAEVLTGLYRVKVRASMDTGAGELSREMETWVLRIEEVNPAGALNGEPPAPGNSTRPRASAAKLP